MADNKIVAKAHFAMGNKFYSPGDEVSAQALADAEIPAERVRELTEVEVEAVEPVDPASLIPEGGNGGDSDDETSGEEGGTTEPVVETPVVETPAPAAAPVETAVPAAEPSEPPSDLAVAMVLEQEAAEILTSVEGDSALIEAVIAGEEAADKPRKDLIKSLKAMVA